MNLKWNTWLLRLVGIQAFCMFCSLGWSQDTLSLFYANGEFKLSPINQSLLNDFIFSHDLKDLDSVHISGYTDVTGKVRQNTKLSHKRAAHVKDRVEALMTRKKPVLLEARGEESEEKNPGINHRRVELILFGKNYGNPEERNDLRFNSNSKLRGQCYVVHDSILMNCFVTPFKRGSSKYLKVQVAMHQIPKEQLYSFSGASLQVKPLKWKLEKLGNSWWQQQVYTTLVKERDFYTYGLLSLRDTTGNASCMACEYDSVQPQLKTSLSPDVAVIQNLQVRLRWWSGKVLLYVPSEFVDVNKRYFFGTTQQDPVFWFQKRGREASWIYIAEMNKAAFRTTGPIISSFHQHCQDSSSKYVKSFGVNREAMHPCGGVLDNVFGRWRGGFELAYWNGTRNSIGVNLYGEYQYLRWFVHGGVGTDIQLNLQSYLGVNYVLYSFVPFASYVLDVNRPAVHDYHMPLLFYSGLGLSNQIGFRSTSETNIFPELHLGVALQNNNLGFGLDRFFIDGGVGLQVNRNPSRPEAYVRIGIRFKI